MGLKIVDVRHLSCTYLLRATYTVGSERITGNISETVEYRAKVTNNDLYKVVQRLSIAAKMYDLE